MSALHLEPGSVFAGDYRIVRPLKEGGMGAVYVSEQLSVGAPRALKLMQAQLVRDPSMRRRFEQEAKIGSRIHSDHVVQVVAAGIDDASGTPWLAMELLEGEDLETLLEHRSALPMDEVQEIFKQLGHALSAAHGAGIIHRDLKPENIFLAASRRPGVPFMVKVLDFGIAKVVADSKTAETTALGTPQWMAPEQTTSQAVTPAADVWALGLIAFRLLIGCHYWQQANHRPASMMSVMREVVLEPLVAASQRARDYGRAQLLPAGFDLWFSRCVVREVPQRFADAQQAVAAFQSLFGGGRYPAPDLHSVGSPLPPHHQYDSRPLSPLPVGPINTPLPPVTHNGGYSQGFARGLSRPTLLGSGLAIAAVSGLFAFAMTRDRPKIPAKPPASSVPEQTRLVISPPVEEPADVNLNRQCDQGEDHFEGRMAQASACAKLCDKGQVSACLKRGALLESSAANEAVKSYRVACEKDSIEACTKVAQLYDKGGPGLPTDRAQAVPIYDKLCTLYKVDAACVSGGSYLYSGTTGVKVDQSAGRKLMNAACQRNYAPACNKFAIWNPSTETKCKKGDHTACMNSCKKGHQESCFLVMKELDRQCLHDSDGTACYFVGTALITGDMSVNKNPEQAIRRMVMACKYAEPRACIILKKLIEHKDS